MSLVWMDSWVCRLSSAGLFTILCLLNCQYSYLTSLYETLSINILERIITRHCFFLWLDRVFQCFFGSCFRFTTCNFCSVEQLLSALFPAAVGSCFLWKKFDEYSVHNLLHTKQQMLPKRQVNIVEHLAAESQIWAKIKTGTSEMCSKS